jgi:hypothetical protein
LQIDAVNDAFADHLDLVQEPARRGRPTIACANRQGRIAHESTTASVTVDPTGYLIVGQRLGSRWNVCGARKRKLKGGAAPLVFARP